MDRVKRHPPGAGSEHGTRARYVQEKCRCAPCRAANTQYYRDRQKRLDELRHTAKPSGPPGEGTLVRRGRPVKVKTCPGANGSPCVRTPPAWLRGQGDVCGACVERATVWNGNVDPAEAREHLLRLRREGVGYKSVHDASDVPSSTLGRVLAGLMPGESEVFGLVALMEIQASRFAARVSADGEPVLLLDQDRRRWDRLLIRRGLDALAHAESLAGDRGSGPYTLQAGIAACHARAARSEETDWRRIVALYDALDQLAPSPVVRLNRAVAVAEAYGPASALELVDALRTDPALQHYHLLPAVRGDLLMRLERLDEARAEFERAAQLTRNSREQALLMKRMNSAGSR